ncbi:TIGR00730 family Rossman fold protein [Shimazuella sp. AN120528]|uniref:LOG family protein n=1 Tax=Shimazuella soli TaxID=1892854 RepID=UPI001F110F8A|nr:TIGR00730 family Rossman fold protein [Shimazuella soli]MCH5584899.1 TIGR00730 family Rossman fold protein [Shimazuella soli]
MKRICVFSGSSLGKQQTYIDLAKLLGTVIAENKLELVYGGAKVGLMGITADSVLENHGTVIGVIPKGLSRVEVVHQNLTELYEVATMHERKAKMTELSDAFIALPGGYGTFEEIMEVVCWGYLGIHRKPIGLLNINGFYDPLIEMIARGAKDGFIRENYERILLIEEDPQVLIEKLKVFTFPEKVFWKEQ